MKTNTFLVALMLASALTAGVAAQQHDQPHPPATTLSAKPGPLAPGTKSPAGPMASCQQMMQMRQDMKAKMKAADDRLDALVTKMNAATGSTKVNATAAVVTELVAQRRQMRDQMMSMDTGMMGHMMEHMQSGNMDCPMMKEIKKPGGER
jgi:hypothetical protein